MADIKRGFLINNLLNNVSHEQPINLAGLADNGISAALAAHYARSGWLERIGVGVYRLAGARLDRDQCLLFLQSRWPGLHVGGKTALAWQGIRHFLSEKEVLTLWGDRQDDLPHWFTARFPSSYSSQTLFSESVSKRGIFTPPDLMPGVAVSTRERALLELLRDVKSAGDLDEARQLFFATAGLRLAEIGAMLEGCRSVRTVRLFLVLAKQAETIDLDRLRREFSIPTGSASRWIGKLADGTKLMLSA